MLDVLRVVLENWASCCDLVSVGGDFNATVLQCHCYSDHTETGRSDAILSDFLSNCPLLRPLPPTEHTWQGCLGQEAALDMWLVSSAQSCE